MKRVFKKIEELNTAYVDVWEDICNIESPSDYKKGVDEVGNYFIALAEERGWKVETFQQDTFGDVVSITMNPDSEGTVVTLSGHMDTVHPVGSFGTPAVRRDGEKIYGPGVMDCKGGIVAGFLAMDALETCGWKDRPVRMLLQSNEEIGSGIKNKATIQYMCEKARDSAAFINLEGYDEEKGKAWLIRRGIAGFRFNITGIAAHSAKCAYEGANAIAEAAYKIIELEKIKEAEGVVCTCNLINGGTARNTVPGKCEFTADVRFTTQEQFEKTFKRIQEIADTVHVPGCTCQLEQTNMRVAMELNERNISLLNKVNKIFSENGLSSLEVGKRDGGSDASDISASGIACLDGLGVYGGRIHSREEYAFIHSLADSAKRLSAIVCGL